MDKDKKQMVKDKKQPVSLFKVSTSVEGRACVVDASNLLVTLCAQITPSV